jgi:hypothetical protein
MTKECERFHATMRGSCGRQQLQLLRMRSGNHRPVAPLNPAAHTHGLAGKPFEVDASGGKCRDVLLDADGEVAPPIIGEIEVDASAALSHFGDLALDKLKALGEAPSRSTLSALSMR